jgi:arylsulfatase A-like enzyme
MVQVVDGHVGELRTMLDEAGLLEGASVVITADHGEGLSEPYQPKPLPTHMGNPSYQPVLAVPLIVWPRVETDPARFMRSDDTFRLIRQLAGLDPGEPPDLEDEELLLSEQLFRTYRRGRWKSLFWRGRDRAVLFDLESEAGELRDVAAEHPDEVKAHRERVETLSKRLAGESGVTQPSPEDMERLRALGYAE